MAEDGIFFLTCREVLDEFERGHLSMGEYMRSLLARTDTHSDLNCFIDLDRDLVASIASRTIRGPLAGIPIAVKDAINTRSLPTTAGTPGLRNHRPESDAEVVASLRKAGALILGKLNMHELSYGITSNNSHTGAVRNPFDRSAIPGGSSGGAGAAVAGGLVPAAIGTDTGGSVRIPAALCGVVGFRPSTGRYSQSGIVPVSHTRDTAGPLCRSVDDAALIDAVISGSEDRLASISPNRITLGVPSNHFRDGLDEDVATVFEERLAGLRHAGVVTKDVHVPEVHAPTEGIGFTIALYETRSDLAKYLEDSMIGVSFRQVIEAVASPDVKATLVDLLDTSFVADLKPAYHKAIRSIRPAMQKTVDAFFRESEIDALIFPTTRLTARPIGQDCTVSIGGEDVLTFPSYIHNTDFGSIVGLPGISLPAGVDRNGLPIGLEIDGPATQDRRLLAIAAAVERLFPEPARPRLSYENKE